MRQRESFCIAGLVCVVVFFVSPFHGFAGADKESGSAVPAPKSVSKVKPKQRTRLDRIKGKHLTSLPEEVIAEFNEKIAGWDAEQCRAELVRCRTGMDAIPKKMREASMELNRVRKEARRGAEGVKPLIDEVARLRKELQTRERELNARIDELPEVKAQADNYTAIRREWREQAVFRSLITKRLDELELREKKRIKEEAADGKDKPSKQVPAAKQDEPAEEVEQGVEP